MNMTDGAVERGVRGGGVEMNTRVTVADLADQIGTEYPREVLYCPNCFKEYSANAGDYWNWTPSTTFKHCRRNMRLGFKVTSFEEA